MSCLEATQLPVVIESLGMISKGANKYVEQVKIYKLQKIKNHTHGYFSSLI